MLPKQVEITIQKLHASLWVRLVYRLPREASRADLVGEYTGATALKAVRVVLVEAFQRGIPRPSNYPQLESDGPCLLVLRI